MKAKPVVPRRLAQQDIDQALQHDVPEDGDQAATAGLIDDLERSFDLISRNPGTGATQYAHELNLPGLRTWMFKRYPYLVFYVEREDHIDIWRVLHSQLDIPAWMQEAAGS